MLSYDAESSWMDVEVKNRFGVGDRLELIVPNGQNREITVEALRNKRNEPIEVAPGSGHQVRIPVPDLQADKVLISRFL
jgi:putative protease